MSTMLHWLISQSLYMIGVEAYGAKIQHNDDNDYFACAWSSVGIISSVTIGTVMLVGLLGLNCRQFESAMPVASSCSVAIAAACHPTFDSKLDGEIAGRRGYEHI